MPRRSSSAGWTSTTLDRPALVDLLRRLGIRTLADFAALPAGDVLARFGFDAAYAHRLASGVDERPLAVRTPPPDLAVTGEYDPPLERVDMAAFAARALAERLHERLAAHGLAATRLGIEAHTAAGEELHRVWRHDGLLDAAALADRVALAARRLAHRHRPGQCAGWTVAGPTHRRHRPAAAHPGRRGPVRRHAARPVGRARRGRRAGAPGAGPGAGPARPGLGLHRRARRRPGVRRAGPPGALGRRQEPQQQAHGDERIPEVDQPWPGRLPTPAPATVLPEPAPIAVRTADGALLAVDARLALTGVPAAVQIGREPAVAVVGWAGPWPVEERWWAPEEANRWRGSSSA